MNKLLVLIQFLVISFLAMPDAKSCSMFKISMYGKTMVGNNEDFWNPNTRIWFEKRANDKYGVAYLGYDNYWPQGGINQAGLVFDGFAEDYLAINDTVGKPPLSEDFINFIMGNFATVDEVKNYLISRNLCGLEAAMLFFVDKSGKYLVAEGDSLITGNNECYIVSNFYPSQIKEADVPIDFYQKGRKYTQIQRDTSVSYCASVMDTMHQELPWGAGTLYSTVYDLNRGIIYLYFYHDFNRMVTYHLNAELEKGNHSQVISDLFPGNTDGQNYLSRYNMISNQVDLLKKAATVHDSVQYKQVSDNLFSNNLRLINTFADRISETGNGWMNDEDYEAAIAVYKIYNRLRSNSESTNKLAGAYMKNKQYDLALFYYRKSLEINPGDPEVTLLIEKIKETYKE